MHTVSVIIAAYNARPFLERAITSALTQSGVTVEVVVIDDCSTDDTRSFAQGLAVNDPRIKVLANPKNSGASVARNTGMQAATGDWISILDADDAFAPDRLRKLIDTAQAQNVDVIGDLPIYFDLAANQEEPNQPTATGTISRLSIPDFLGHDEESGVDLGLMQPVFRRALIENGTWVYPTALHHGEDFALVISALRKGVSMALLRERMYVYSTRIGAITGQVSPGSVTQVNYHQVGDNAASLIEDMRQAGDLTPELETQLTSRIEKARTANRRYGWSTLRRGDLTRLSKWLRTDPRNRRDMLEVLRQKLTGQRGLPK